MTISTGLGLGALGLTDHHPRMQLYAHLMARALHASGKRCDLGKLLINPRWRFFRGYFLRLGFLDGWRGLVFALIEANYTTCGANTCICTFGAGDCRSG